MSFKTNNILGELHLRTINTFFFLKSRLPRPNIYLYVEYSRTCSQTYDFSMILSSLKRQLNFTQNDRCAQLRTKTRILLQQISLLHYFQGSFRLCNRLCPVKRLEAILTSRQSREKLQYIISLKRLF